MLSKDGTVEERGESFKCFHEGGERVLVTTDVMAQGAAAIAVINCVLPSDWKTPIQRMGIIMLSEIVGAQSTGQPPLRVNVQVQPLRFSLGASISRMREILGEVCSRSSKGGHGPSPPSQPMNILASWWWWWVRCTLEPEYPWVHSLAHTDPVNAFEWARSSLKFSLSPENDEPTTRVTRGEQGIPVKLRSRNILSSDERTRTQFLHSWIPGL